MCCRFGGAPADREPAGFAQRKAELIAALSDNGMGLADSLGKHNLTVCLARLAASGGADSAARDYLSRAANANYRHPGWGDEGDFFFTWIHMVRGLYLFGDRLSARQRATMRDQATRFRRWFKGDVSVYPGHDNPVTGGTENHRLMTWTSAYLFAQYWPDARWIVHVDSAAAIDSPALMARMRALLAAHGASVYASGNVEFLSPRYELYHLIPLLNLFDFARDPRMRAVAEALCAYHMSSYAANLFEGRLLAPLTRNASQARIGELANAQYIGWLYWGLCSPSAEAIDASKYGARQVIPLALSSWRPAAAQTALARDVPRLTPFTSREVKPFWEARPPRYCMREVYRTGRYAIGAGVTRTLADRYLMDNSQFAIVWRSNDSLNTLECFHPYWYSDRGEDFWAYPCSPFQQSLVHENVAIAVFAIPDTDPWQSPGRNPRWLSERDGHFESLIKLAQCRYPSSIDERAARGDWIFVREAETYLGIRPFGGDVAHCQSGAYRVIKNRGGRVGFVFELGDADEFGDFASFQASLARAAFAIDTAEGLRVTYTGSRGATLRIDARMGGRPPDYATPDCWVDGRRVRYDSWPVMENPAVTIRRGVLTEHLGADRRRIDWRGPWPVISRL